jgi:TonB family protein
VTRTILVPPDIVAVQRRSPSRVRKRTPWHPQPDGTTATARPGDRDWFSDRLFVEGERHHVRLGLGTSITLHTCSGIALAVMLWTRPVQPVAITKPPSLVMPVSLTMPLDVPQSFAAHSTAHRVEATKMVPKSTLPAAPPPPVNADRAAPLEAPAEIGSDEPGLDGSAPLGVEGGVEDGLPGGVPGGVAGGTAAQSVRAEQGPLHAGRDVKAPQKIKDVRPNFPPAAMAARLRGTVVVEATIGPDGRVQSTKLLQSIPLLDEAALDAICQWEYVPTFVSGNAVAVVVTVTIQFALH